MDTNGCYLINYDDQGYNCGCWHATYFGMTGWEDFTPEINFLSKEEWRSITFENLWKYPLGWVVVLCVIFSSVFVIAMFRIHRKKYRLCNLCDKCDNIEDKPLIAQSILDASNISQYRSVREMELVQDKNWQQLGFCSKFLKLFAINLNSDHLWLGICFRSFGTGYTHTQRIAILMVRLLISLCIVALFYGRAKQTPIGDLSLS